MLKGKNAIITGARGGIGMATVKVFAENGANVWACDLAWDDESRKQLRKDEEKYNVWIKPVEFSITNDFQIKNFTQMLIKEKHAVDILVNNAGITAESTTFHMTSIDKIKEVMSVNFYGMTLMSQYISRLMARVKKGSIINIASVAGIDGTPAQYEYVASKAAVIGATKELAIELGKQGIRVNAVAPGITDTRMGEKVEEKLKNDTLTNTIMKRLAKPEEIANVIAFLASDKAGFITGQVLRVDGGMI